MSEDQKDQLIEKIQLIHDYNINVEERSIYLHGHKEAAGAEEGEPGVEYLMANKFIKNMHFLDSLNKKPITVHMHSIGGEWNDGMAMYDVIKSVKSPVHIYAHAWARSMTSIIFQAATKRIMMPHCDFMIHYGASGFEGHCIAFISSAEWTVKANDVMVDIYTKRCKKGAYFVENKFTYKQVKEFLIDKMNRKSDWWISAKEAVMYGFADEVYS